MSKFDVCDVCDVCVCVWCHRVDWHPIIELIVTQCLSLVGDDRGEDRGVTTVYRIFLTFPLTVPPAVQFSSST